MTGDDEGGGTGGVDTTPKFQTFRQLEATGESTQVSGAEKKQVLNHKTAFDSPAQQLEATRFRLFSRLSAALLNHQHHLVIVVVVVDWTVYVRGVCILSFTQWMASVHSKLDSWGVGGVSDVCLWAESSCMK